MKDLSVIIPAYNEERRLPGTLTSIYGYLKNSKRSFEILVVDDGSEDHTIDVVDAFAVGREEVSVLSYQPNQGKGYALRRGVLAAKGQCILIDDADGSSPIEELERLESGIASGADIAIGSRAKPDASRKVEALAYRRFIGNTFNAIVQLLLPGIQDSQCGFKLFKLDVAQDLFSVSLIKGFGFDVEVLYVARQRGYATVEVPINWHNVAGSKVNVLIDSPRMLVELLIVAFNNLLGKYRRLPMRTRSTTWPS